MTDGTSPTARALMTLVAIQESPGIGAERLARRLGVTTRAVRRYVGILREADIPVESVRGPEGGYRLGRGVRLPPIVFSSDEALGLVMAVLDGHHAASDAEDLVGAAVAKLLRAMPQHVAEQADVVRRMATTAPDRSAARPDPGVAVALVRAAADRRRVALGYRSEAGRDLDLDVEPWAVVVRHGRWYLLCRSLRAGAVRTYRVDRVRSVTVLEHVFDPPAGLDPVAVLEEHLGTGWEHRTEVVVAAPLADVEWLPRTMGRLEAVDARTTRLVGSTGNLAGYAADLARLPVPFRVVDGDGLREAVAALAARLSDAARVEEEPAGAAGRRAPRPPRDAPSPT